MRSVGSYSLVHQFVAASVLISGAIILVLALFVSHRTYSMMLDQVQVSLQTQVHGTRKLMDTAYEISVGLTDQLSAILVSNFPDGLVVSESETAPVGDLVVPLLRYQGRPLNLDFRIVDEFSRMTGGVATLFVRQGDDFIRVTTSLKNESGQRAIGTRLAHDHPAYAKMLVGEPFLGVATLFGKVYMTKYIPARGADGKVIAIMFVGFDLAPVIASLKATVGEQQYGRSGHGFVMKTAAPNQGVLMFHPSLAGKNLLKEGRDAVGNNPFEDLLNAASGVLSYPSKDAAGTVMTQLLAYEKTDTWGGLVVAGGGYVEEYTEASRSLRSTILVACGGAALALGGLLWLLMLNRLRPVAGVVDMLERMGAGDMSVRVNRTIAADTRNELDIIARCVNTTAQNVGGLIAGLRQNAAAIEHTALNLAQTATSLAQTASSQRDAANAMSAGAQQIAGSVSLVSDRAEHSRAFTQQTLTLARRGRQTTDGVLGQMTQIESSVQDAATHIEQLDVRSQQISTVVSIIREIADQTNLLALNAAIEAARAGEQGRGFTVVADEVRKLAERTSKSTGEISGMVEAIQVGAHEAVVGMRNAVGSVKTGVEAVHGAQQAIGDIGSGASAIAEASVDIASALTEQAKTSCVIGQEVERINALSEITAASAQDSAAAVEELRQLSAAMSVAVAKFRVD